MAPLNMKIRKDQQLKFGPLKEKALNAMNTLKETLVFSPILALPDSTGHMTLNEDVCHIQVVLVLLERQEDEIT